MIVVEKKNVNVFSEIYFVMLMRNSPPKFYESWNIYTTHSKSFDLTKTVLQLQLMFIKVVIFQ